MASEERSKRRWGATSALFCAVAVAWFAFDRVTKVLVDTVDPGTVLVPDVLGLFDFVLVHNTGAAWGLFDDSTFALGVFSLVVCLAVAVYVVAFGRGRVSRAEALCLAFVAGGGLGNAYDRFAQGYVTDFIHTTFMDFPVFNVADIGVTCGIVAFVVVLLVESRRMPAGGGEGTGGDGLASDSDKVGAGEAAASVAPQADGR